MIRRLFASVALLAALCAGCVSDRQVISQAAEIHAGLEPAVMKDPVLVDYMRKIGDRIIATAVELDRQGFGPASHRQGEDDQWMYRNMQFHLVNSKTLNAFTTGGKHMYIYNELFQTCKNEDELVAVMCHEYAHVYCRHVAKGMNRQLAILGATAGAGVAGYAAGGREHGQEYASVAAGAAMLAGQFIGMSFTREDEDEADKIGFWIYAHAGWDPHRFAGFFQTLIDKGYDKTPEALSDHPKLSSRVAATQRRIKQLPPQASQWRRPPIADDNHFRQLQARAASLARKMPNDKSLQQAQLMLASFSSCVTPEDQPDQKNAQAIIYRAMQQQKKTGQTR